MIYEYGYPYRVLKSIESYKILDVKLISCSNFQVLRKGTNNIPLGKAHMQAMSSVLSETRAPLPCEVHMVKVTTQKLQ